MSILGALAVGAGVANAVGSLGSTILNQYNADMTRKFNRDEAEKNRTFQRDMAQNNIKYAVQQASELGISPSLVLGSQTNALGGSQASVGNPPNSSIDAKELANVLQEQKRLNTTEEMNEDKLQTMERMNQDRLQTMEKINQNKMQTMKDIQNMKMGNSTTNFDNYIKRNGYNSKEEYLKDMYDDLDNIQL